MMLVGLLRIKCYAEVVSPFVILVRPPGSLEPGGLLFGGRMKKSLSTQAAKAVISSRGTSGMQLVGITKTGNLVWMPKGECRHLSADQALCCVCATLAHKRDAIVDLEGNVYHKVCFEPMKQLPPGPSLSTKVEE